MLSRCQCRASCCLFGVSLCVVVVFVLSCWLAACLLVAVRVVFFLSGGVGVVESLRLEFRSSWKLQYKERFHQDLGHRAVDSE